jgi:hypothetical protein
MVKAKDILFKRDNLSNTLIIIPLEVKKNSHKIIDFHHNVKGLSNLKLKLTL